LTNEGKKKDKIKKEMVFYAVLALLVMLHALP
jgi:hypothetical protein